LQVSIDGLTDALGSGEAKMEACKTSVDNDITALHSDMAALHGDMTNLRSDMRMLVTKVGNIETHLGVIATTMQQLADFGPTWSKIKGFWAVLQWLKENWIILGILTALLWLASGVPVLGAFK
jgi:hypothetical protein